MDRSLLYWTAEERKQRCADGAMLLGQSVWMWRALDGMVPPIQVGEFSVAALPRNRASAEHAVCVHGDVAEGVNG